ncbi:hypothetical protein A3F58_00450 [Candidatus Roizmanbacteria bacterium RIFCSPHIGHO2_12_FULL_37_9b]|nr:MAG: hypothetical protein A3F58_00450 [Candidatus Roizmanbacteria bacterium RIFCSPHIGHO2_12_FULL_37_9b]
MSLRIRVILPILIILFAVFLRFYKFEDFAMFLGDQGRDAIIIKRIITFEHFPAIGAPSSLGQIFLGPFYYYLIAPFLLFFNFKPVGPAVGVAVFSILGLIASYVVIRKETNYLVALIFTIFLTFSAVNIQFSRFSWNPNLLPIFSFFTLYFFYKTITTKNKLHAVLFGSFLSFSIQLHHLALLLFLPIVLSYLSFRAKSRNLLHADVKEISPRASFGRNDIEKIFISLISFLFFSLPLIIFDLRHNFLNTRNFINFFTEGNPTDHEQLFSRFLEINRSFYLHVLQLNMNHYIALFLTIAIIFLIVKKHLSPKFLFIYLHAFNFIFFIVVFSFFNSSRNAHYYSSIYLSFFLVLSWIITNIVKNKTVQFFVLSLTVLTYIYLNFKSLNYLFLKTGNNQIKKAETIALSMLKENPLIPFQTIALPYVETDGHIRYFLELNGKRPLPADTLEEPKELYVLCFEKDCQVLGNPQWQIAAFKKAKIDKIWTVEGIKIYKLIHINN